MEDEEKKSPSPEQPDGEQENQSPIEEAYEEFGVTEAIMDGSALVEEFSPHGTVEMLAHASPRISENAVHYVMSAVYFVIGLVCVIFTSQMLSVLSYVVGSFMALIGVIQFIAAIKHKEFKQTSTNKTAGSLILIGLAVMILVDREWADGFIPIVWGVIGLFEGAHAFNHAFSRISRGMRCSYYIVKGIIELVLAFLLLYEPVHHITLHVIVFGANLIFDAITMLPVVRKFTEGN